MDYVQRSRDDRGFYGVWRKGRRRRRRRTGERLWDCLRCSNISVPSKVMYARLNNPVLNAIRWEAASSHEQLKIMNMETILNWNKVRFRVYSSKDVANPEMFGEDNHYFNSDVDDSSLEMYPVAHIKCLCMCTCYVLFVCVCVRVWQLMSGGLQANWGVVWRTESQNHIVQHRPVPCAV